MWPRSYEITRAAADAYALSSQQRWAAADKAGAFEDELVACRGEDSQGNSTLRARRAPASRHHGRRPGQADLCFVLAAP